MTKKDWGDTVYCVSYTNYINGKYVQPRQASITEQKITKLGNKYLYTNNWTRFEIDTGKEDKDYGDMDVVFPTKQAADEYVKRNYILDKLWKYLNRDGIVVVKSLRTEILEELLEYFEQEDT